MRVATSAEEPHLFLLGSRYCETDRMASVRG